MEIEPDGYQNKKGFGLYFYAGPGYWIYKSYQCEGVKLPVRWLAIHRKSIISRHRKRKDAERACEAHRIECK